HVEKEELHCLGPPSQSNTSSSVVGGPASTRTGADALLMHSGSNVVVTGEEERVGCGTSKRAHGDVGCGRVGGPCNHARNSQSLASVGNQVTLTRESVKLATSDAVTANGVLALMGK
ncbi:hypothetical protein FOZ63_016005, partial [Perkinsus olseni]